MDETINRNGGKTIIIYHPMQGIDSYLPETKNVYTVYGVTAILYIQFVVHVMLYSMINVLYLN